MIEDDKNVHLAAEGDESKEAMDTAYKWTCRGAGIMTVLLIFIWPLFSLPAGTFSKSYFAFWVFLAFIWGHVAFAITVILPIHEFVTEYYSTSKAGEGIGVGEGKAEDDGTPMQPMPAPNSKDSGEVMGFTAGPGLSPGDFTVSVGAPQLIPHETQQLEAGPEPHPAEGKSLESVSLLVSS